MALLGECIRSAHVPKRAACSGAAELLKNSFDEIPFTGNLPDLFLRMLKTVWTGIQTSCMSLIEGLKDGRMEGLKHGTMGVLKGTLEQWAKELLSGVAD